MAVGNCSACDRRQASGHTLAQCQWDGFPLQLRLQVLLRLFTKLCQPGVVLHLRNVALGVVADMNGAATAEVYACEPLPIVVLEPYAVVCVTGCKQLALAVPLQHGLCSTAADHPGGHAQSMVA